MRSARSRTWLADSSPLTTSAGVGWPAAHCWATSSSRVDLPTPGLAGEQHHRAGHDAAAEHPVELADPGGPGQRRFGADGRRSGGPARPGARDGTGLPATDRRRWAAPR